MALILAGCGRLHFDERVAEPLVLSGPARINLNTSVPLTASGGVAPYFFALVVGNGELDADSGMYRSPAYAGNARLEVRDATGDTASHELSYGGDYLYAVGGHDGTTTRDDVWRSSDGAQWSVIGQLPLTREGGVFIVHEDRMLYLGGADVPDGVAGDHVFESFDGVTWTQIGQLPEPREAPGGAVFRGRVWIGGGIGVPSSVAFTAQVWSSADGITWQPEPPLPGPLHGAAFVPWRDQLWSVAGHEAAGQLAALSAYDGTSWRSAGAVPVAGEYHATTVIDDQLWIAGGVGLFDRVVTTSDGVAFADRGNLSGQRSHAGMFSFAGEIWIVGGTPSQPVHSPDGSAWSTAGMFPASPMFGTRYVTFTPR